MVPPIPEHGLAYDLEPPCGGDAGGGLPTARVRFERDEKRRSGRRSGCSEVNVEELPYLVDGHRPRAVRHRRSSFSRRQDGAPVIPYRSVAIGQRVMSVRTAVRRPV